MVLRGYRYVCLVADPIQVFKQTSTNSVHPNSPPIASGGARKVGKGGAGRMEVMKQASQQHDSKL